MEISWLQLVGLALGSGFTVKLVDIGYQEILRRREGSLTARRFVDEHLDPILKAADELVGKLEALGREGFRPLRMLETGTRPGDNNDLGGLMFLFARFWAHVEIIRREGLSIAISQDERGRRLQNFFDCLESRRVRLLDRTAQRAIGETSLEVSSGKLQTMAYIEFVDRAEDPQTARWLEPLRQIIVRGWHTAQRQKLLIYATVLLR